MARLDVPGSIWTQPFGINDRGQISGGYYDAEGNQHGFLFERGSYKTLDAPGRTDNIAWGHQRPRADRHPRRYRAAVAGGDPMTALGTTSRPFMAALAVALAMAGRASGSSALT
jgi:hypothetical protein